MDCIWFQGLSFYSFLPPLPGSISALIGFLKVPSPSDQIVFTPSKFGELRESVCGNRKNIGTNLYWIPRFVFFVPSHISQLRSNPIAYRYRSSFNKPFSCSVFFYMWNKIYVHKILGISATLSISVSDLLSRKNGQDDIVGVLYWVRWGEIRIAKQKRIKLRRGAVKIAVKAFLVRKGTTVRKVI